MDERVREQILCWHATVGLYVALRDCLLLSFALDYDREDGAPSRAQTRIGTLRYRAKPYDGTPTRDTFEAAGQLAQECLSFLRSMTCYQGIDAVVAMPPSRPDKPFDLPRHLARGIAIELGKEDHSDRVVTIESRPPLKNATKTRSCSKSLGRFKVPSGWTELL
ncbi:MAG TPA: hypothetical protein VGR07_06995 [Thermoanaerobaculia bacterium]|nr:hypothetical protein [Thermoanaerobaculia bacterium]